MKLSLKSEGIVYNIQRFSIHDGPGVRTTVFLKGCPLSCFWCHNPESQRALPELFYNSDTCVACEKCIPACPEAANFMGSDGKAAIDRQKCTGCGSCIPVCPAEARTTTGKLHTADEVMATVLKDRKYYANSGGGVTLSGGEPAAQPGFALAILKRCGEEGIHTTVETCGFAPWDILEQLIEYTDLVYYDIKCIDPERHKAGTGVTNELILDNAVKAAKRKPILVRVPVIPNFNDDAEELGKIAVFAKEELGGARVELLKYNNLCQSKYIRLDRPFEGETETPPDAQVEEHMNELRNMVSSKF